VNLYYERYCLMNYEELCKVLKANYEKTFTLEDDLALMASTSHGLSFETKMVLRYRIEKKRIIRN
jgi:hypothetical protein